jgi:hypothetical protein
MRRRSKARALLLAGFFASSLTSCSYIPRTVEGLDPATVTHLPLRAWLHNEGLTVRAMAGCFSADCPKVAVGLVTAVGEQRDRLEALLRDPAPLLRAIEAADAADTGRVRKSIRTTVSATPARVGSSTGFLMTMADAGGERSPALILAVGERREETLNVVLVVGTADDAVRTTAAEVVRRDRP